MDVGTVIGIISVLGLLAAGVAVSSFARASLRDLRGLLGGRSVKAALEEQARHLAEMPKSVSAMTNVFLPQIARDFPQFGWSEFRAKAQNILRAALLAIGAQSPMGELSPLSSDSASPELLRQVALAVEDDKRQGIRSRYEQVAVHRTEIGGYTKRDGACVVLLQSAVGHLRWQERDGVVISGSKTVPVQTKYNMELVFVQDEEKYRGARVTGAGLSCPNCGAPVPGLGEKQCAYCGMAVAELNLRVWAFTRFWEVL